MSSFEEVLAHLDSAPEGKGQAFETAVKWWLSNDDSWSSFFLEDSIRLWRDSEVAEGPDIGIDLTAKDHLGRHWAIQVKNWRKEKALPKSEVDKFLSASNTKTFHGRLLISTTESISRNAVRAMADQEKPCVVVTYESLAQSIAWEGFFSQPDRKTERKQKALLPHQVTAVTSILGEYAKGVSRTQLIMACGTGKTLTSQRIAERLEADLTIFLVPSLLLVQQSRSSWLDNHPRQAALSVLAVCSDTSVADDELASSIIDLPFPVTSEPTEIVEFLRIPGSKVIFSTYQSFSKVSSGLIEANIKPDLVICDEAHKLAGPKAKKLSLCLRDISLSDSKYLFMTATPKIFLPALRGVSDLDSPVLSMNDTKTFGSVGFEYSFGAAIRDKRLARYEVVIMPITDSEARSEVEARSTFNVEGQDVDAEMLASHIGLAKAMTKYRINRVISFHSRINRARDFANFHKLLSTTLNGPEWFQGVETAVLTGSDTTRRRRVVLDALAATGESEFSLVTNARCLTEGIDIPALDGICFVDPKSSQIDIVQAVGRAIRRGSANKEVGYIVLPVFISQESVELGELDSGRFRHVVSVLNALRSHDENLVVTIDKLRHSLGRHGVISALPEHIYLDTSSEVPPEFFEQIQAMIIRGTSASWEEFFGELERFISINGHAQLSAISQTENEKRLYRWVNTQRSQKRNGVLSEDRTRRLNGLAHWVWIPFDEAWERGLAALAAHFSAGGTSTVPRNFKVDGVNLFNWMRVHRNKSDRLTPERKAQLDAFPQWKWAPFKEAWDNNYRLLSETLAFDGDWRLTLPNETERRSLREWIQYQRGHRYSRLDAGQRSLLEQLPGWQWSDDRWGEMYALLLSYVDEFGTSRVVASKTYRGKRLGGWVANQRALYKKGKVDEERVKLLEVLNGWTWKLSDDDWDEKYQSLLAYLESHDLSEISYSTTFRNFGLGQWTSHNRRSRITLSAAKVKKLEAIPGWYFGTSFDHSFNQAFRVLRDYVQEFGTSLVPYGYKYKGFNLGTWRGNRFRNMSALTETQRESLEALPDWNRESVDLPRLTTILGNGKEVLPFKSPELRWAEWKSLMDEFVVEFSVSDLSNTSTYKSKNLGSWLYRQRLRRSVLSIEQASWLESLPGWTWGPRRDSGWWAAFESLQGYAEKYGTSRVPFSAKFEGASVGSWVSSQRKIRAKLDPDKVSSLEQLPKWSWDPRNDDWAEKFQVFASRPEINFYSRANRDLKIHAFVVGSWVREQGRNWSKLSVEQQNLLAACPHWRPITQD